MDDMLNMFSMLETDLLLLGSGLCAFLSVLFLRMTARQLSRTVPADDREFKDPLPLVLRLIWPAVRILAYYCCSLLPFAYLHSIENRLRRNGVSYMMMAE
ncbi:MAG TPA: hypothetical protein VJ969_01190, partial [Desulfopila sp.]|nr:hypothetical protein [Desulfopila sp.]